MRYRVTTEGSIITRRTKNGGGQMRTPGMEITSEEIGEHALPELLRDKKIIEIGVYEVGERQVAPLPPKTEINTPDMQIASDGRLKAVVAPAHPVDNPTGQVADFKNANANPNATGPEKPISPWTFLPEELESKDLAQLNAMILERAPAMQPFDDRSEAVAQLCLDGKRKE